jgi:hypothetical protein
VSRKKQQVAQGVKRVLPASPKGLLLANRGDVQLLTNRAAPLKQVHQGRGIMMSHFALVAGI